MDRVATLARDLGPTLRDSGYIALHLLAQSLFLLNQIARKFGSKPSGAVSNQLVAIRRICMHIEYERLEAGANQVQPKQSN